MADWAPPSDSALTEGKPIRDIDLRAIRDLVEAGFRGAPSSPTLSPWAAARAPVTAGDTNRMLVPLTFTSTVTNFLVVHTASVMNHGTVRIKATFARIDGTGQARAQVSRVRAGVETEVVAETASSPLAFDYDLEPGDTIIWRLRCQDSGATCTMTGVALGTGGELLHPIPPFYSFGSAPT